MTLPNAHISDDVVYVRRLQRRAWGLTGGIFALFCSVLYFCAWIVDFDITQCLSVPSRLWQIFGDMVPAGIVATPVTALHEWFANGHIFVRALGETLLIALLGTVLGVTLGLWLALGAAVNVSESKIGRFASRRTAEVLRIVPELLFALIFVNAFGLGALAGVLAVGLHSAGSFAKMLTERIENSDLSAAHALQAAGVSRMGRLRFGIWPTIVPDVLNLSLLRLEMNVRASSAVGIVGAGGLGQELKIAIDQFSSLDTGAILLLMAVVVMTCSGLSQYARQKLRLAGTQAVTQQLCTETTRTLKQRRITNSIALVLVVLGGLSLAIASLGVSWQTFGSGLIKTVQIFALMLPPTWDLPVLTYAKALGETVAAVLLGTTLAACIALPLALMAASRYKVLQWICRRFFDLIRSIDMLIWALIFVGMVGPGAFAGTLAIAAAEIGILARLFCDSALTVDPQPTEGVYSTGGTTWHATRYALLPQVTPDWLANWLYQIESNIRSASILGVAGAGGIGFFLAENIRLSRFPEAAGVLLLLLVVVILVDKVSQRLRQRIQCGSSHRATLPTRTRV